MKGYITAHVRPPEQFGRAAQRCTRGPPEVLLAADGRRSHHGPTSAIEHRHEARNVVMVMVPIVAAHATVPAVVAGQ